MKKKLLFFSIISFALISCLIVYYNFFSFQNASSNLDTTTLSKINNGDLILRCGRSTESFAVYLADDNSEFTHIGIISIENEITYVIHAVPHKNKLVKKENINEFLKSKNASKYAVYRSNYNPFFLNKVVKEANSFYTQKYEFDNEYDLTTNTKLYCTELVLKAFNNVGLSLKVKTKEFNYMLGKHNIIFPSEFTKNPIFYRII